MRGKAMQLVTRRRKEKEVERRKVFECMHSALRVAADHTSVYCQRAFHQVEEAIREFEEYQRKHGDAL